MFSVTRFTRGAPWGSRAAAVLLLCGLAAAAGGTASAAPSPLPALQPAANREIDHTCKLMGTDQQNASDADYNEAVHCADLIEIPDSSGSGGLYYGQNEILCEHHGADLVVQTVRCAGIHETADVSRTDDPNVAGGREDIQASGICGVRFGHSACSAGRVVTSTQGFYMFPGVTGYTGEVWAASVSDSVVLPDSGKTVPAKTTNVATPHLVIAP